MALSGGLALSPRFGGKAVGIRGQEGCQTVSGFFTKRGRQSLLFINNAKQLPERQ